MTIPRNRIATIALVAAHVALLNGVFAVGFSPESRENDERAKWHRGEATTWSAIRLYFSKNYDERLYYELANLTLGFSVSAERALDTGSRLLDKLAPFDPPRARLPYRDIPIEYPALALLAFIPPRLVTALWGGDFTDYQHILGLFLTAFTLGSIFFAYRTLRRLGLIGRRGPVPLLALSLLFHFGLGVISTHRFDPLVAFFVAAMLDALTAGRLKTAAILLALGVSTKIYPLFLAPLLVIPTLVDRRFADAARSGAVFSLALALVNLPPLLASPSGYVAMLSFQGERGVLMESTYGSILLVAHVLFGYDVTRTLTHGSWELVSSASSTLVSLSHIVLPAAIAAVYAAFARAILKNKEATARNILALDAALAIVAALLAFSKIFSPQFVLWLFPLAFLSTHHRKRRVVALITAAFLTQIYFPRAYPILYQTFNPALVTVLFLRNAAVGFLFFDALVGLWRSKARHA
ncbi:MAG: hypothetical protein HYY84_18445 [Deltaproteobacteria bacterium]|nr:hypothetical protein [Deltaproteobacteria bacterium]